MKQRFSALDIRASVHDIQARIVGLRLQNVYDINARTFLLKFSQPDRKEYLVVESGIRLHLTEFSREKAVTPSQFCIKLRKHLRTRRLTGVRQAGVDRIVEFEFSAAAGLAAAGTYHLICEFYASGNVILTDHDFTVLTLLRVVKTNPPPESKAGARTKGKVKLKENERGLAASENAFSLAVKDVYDLAALSRAFEPASSDHVVARLIELRDGKSKEVLKKVINHVCLYGPPLSEHALLEAGLNPNLTAVDEAVELFEGSEFRRRLEEALTIADNLIQTLDKTASSGYILLGKPGKGEGEIYVEFHPVLFRQHRECPHKAFPSFVAALDEFFSKVEGQRAAQRAQAQEDAARAKLEAIKAEQMGRVDALSQAEIHHRHLAAAIEANLELVDRVILVLRSLVATSMDWRELADLVSEEARKGNYLAMRVSDLKLHINSVTLTLPDPHAVQETTALSDSDSSDTEEMPTDSAPLKVDIDLGLSAHANASRYYHLKKASAVKKDKTLSVAVTAFRNAERKVQLDLDQAKLSKPNVGVTRMRKPFWFEKFMWFVTSEGYLVIAGRDLQQNELIVKKYMDKGDLYVHADMHGAATVIIKNPRGGPVPPSTLNQAGTLSICQSRAWDAKILTSAWWVFHNQVSKTAPTGEFLAAGSFIIRGRKNFLAPAALTYGFGLMYLLDAPSAARRLQARLKREQEEQLESPQPVSEAVEGLTECAPEAADKVASGLDPEPHRMVAQEKPPIDKYGLPSSAQLQEPVEPSSEEDPGLPAKEPKKYVSAKERRVMKKGGASGSKPAATHPKDGGSNAPLPRGQKSKKKKIQQKYADQDDEERQERMALLGSGGAPQPKGKKAKRLAEQRRLREQAAKPAAEEPAAEYPSQTDEAKQLPVEPTLEIQEEDTEIRQLLEEENVVVLDEEETQSLQQNLDGLAGELQAGEVAEYLVPVSAPYSALSKLKFKVKLQPGTMKKGKAAKVALTIFQTSKDCSESDRELMRRVPDQDCINAILAKCKVVPPPNYTPIKNAAKKLAKQRAKDQQRLKPVAD